MTVRYAVLRATLNSFGQASDIKCPKLITKNTRMFSKVEFTDRSSETESDSDSAEGTDGEDEVSASSVIYSSKNSQQPVAGCKINYEISQEIFSFLHLSH